MWCALGQCYEHEHLGMLDAAIRCYRRAVDSNDREGLALHKLVSGSCFYHAAATCGEAQALPTGGGGEGLYTDPKAGAMALGDHAVLNQSGTRVRRPEYTLPVANALLPLATTPSTWLALTARVQPAATAWRPCCTWRSTPR